MPATRCSSASSWRSSSPTAGWQVDVAVGSVIGRWPEIVGPDVAEHVQPVSFDAGVLTLRAVSTAWATQMRLLTSVLLGRLDRRSARAR